MSTLNKACIIGRLGKDPELRYTPNSTAVCNFSVATTENYKKDGKREEKTEWHNVVAWSKLAELCNKYLNKGSQCFVEGALQTRSWEKDGIKRYTTEIVAKNVQFLDSKSSNEDRENQTGFTVDDTPF